MLLIREPSLTDRITSLEVRLLVRQRITMLSADGPYDPDVCGYFIVFELGDNLECLDEQLGFSVLGNRFDGKRFGDFGFTPCWEILEEHASCYEMVLILSDDGYGVEVFIPKDECVDPALLVMCQQYAVPASKATEPTAP